MSLHVPKISPGKGRWPKGEKKRAARKRNLSAAASIKTAIERQSGFYRSSGAASPCRQVELTDVEAAALLARLKTGT
jgi:hypothetical protein